MHSLASGALGFRGSLHWRSYHWRSSWRCAAGWKNPVVSWWRRRPANIRRPCSARSALAIEAGSPSSVSSGSPFPSSPVPPTASSSSTRRTSCIRRAMSRPLMVVLAGAAGLIGLLAGRWLADHLGRRPTGSLAMIAVALTPTLAYSGSSAALVVGYVLGVLCGGLVRAGARSSAHGAVPDVGAGVGDRLVGDRSVIGAVVGLVFFGAVADVGSRFGVAAELTFLPRAPWLRCCSGWSPRRRAASPSRCGPSPTECSAASTRPAPPSGVGERHRVRRPARRSDDDLGRRRARHLRDRHGARILGRTARRGHLTVERRHDLAAGTEEVGAGDLDRLADRTAGGVERGDDRCRPGNRRRRGGRRGCLRGHGCRRRARRHRRRRRCAASRRGSAVPVRVRGGGCGDPGTRSGCAGARQGRGEGRGAHEHEDCGGDHRGDEPSLTPLVLPPAGSFCAPSVRRLLGNRASTMGASTTVASTMGASGGRLGTCGLGRSGGGTGRADPPA